MVLQSLKQNYKDEGMSEEESLARLGYGNGRG